MHSKKEYYYEPYMFFNFNDEKNNENKRKFSQYKDIATKFINNENLESETNYLIWVDTKEFKTNVFLNVEGTWKIIRSYPCSIGKKETPTPLGKFKVGVKGLYFGENHGYRCWYYTQFKNNYLFHSILYNLDGSIRDDRLGYKISNGCVRLEINNAKWIYSNVPENSLVYIS